MPATNMTGLRKYRFVSGGTLELVGTDFFVEYAAQKTDQGLLKALALRQIWERCDETVLQGRPRRKYMEDRMQDIIWNYVGKKGTLTVDLGFAEAVAFADITLVGVSPNLAEFNDSMEYDLEFAFPFDGVGGSLEIARSFRFDTGANNKVVASENLFVEEAKADRTSFKPIFRAAPIRIANGPGLKTVSLTAIRKVVAGGSDLIKRQNSEVDVRDWLNNYVGETGALYVDDVITTPLYAVAHLANLGAHNFAQPGYVGYELTFLTGYGV